ncbi:hypothetical protein sscle_10g080070 [Sclerotinia sclerotiorum 1980 UF-70]|uniref:Sister chromatid cohesion protein dcc1 n=1 Tax=Sclerotinia sclerotiorum (strain ATCC 18683 / 1980 / Ss-1) TaxID=665079 RepID=A0A1D9QE72_SCLS1|nr:hypothetical protein sscle_10g080070 [Sclerotinia sclerotiorum 1980 UF-70]
MSTQYANSIPFTANHTQQAFKLLELPPELLTLLESDTPPTLQISASSYAPHHAHLSVSNTASNHILKTYTLRQKNTSNPLMLLSPSSVQKIPEEEQEQEQAPSSFTSITQPSITRISSVDQTIELIEQEEEQDLEGQGQGGENSKQKEKPVKVNKWHEKFAQSRGRTSK